MLNINLFPFFISYSIHLIQVYRKVLVKLCDNFKVKQDFI